MPRRFLSPEVTIDESSGWAEFVDQASEEQGEETFDGNETDFARLLRLHGESNHGDDLVRAVRLREKLGGSLDGAAAADVAAGLPGVPSGQRVLINPDTGSAVLGNTRTVTSGNEMDCAYWSGEDGSATVMTVHASVQPIQAGWPNVVTGASYRPYVKVRWGTRGVFHTVTADIGLGCTLVVAGSSIYVVVGMSPTSASNPAAGTMQLGASVGFFSATPASPPTRTVFVDSLAQSSTVNVLIPAFAQTLLAPGPGVWSVATGTYTLSVKDVAGNVIMSVPSTTTTPTPIPTDAYSIDVANGGDVSKGSLTLRLAFQLGL